MARMSIDDKFPRDPRVIKLGRRVGWSRRETMGALIDVFQIVYDRERDTLPAEDIDIAAEREGFAEHMIECDLAERTRAGVRVKGAAERIDYLKNRAEAGRVGGLKSGESRRNSTEANARSKRSTASSGAEASRNPPDPVPDPPPVPDGVPDLERETAPASPPLPTEPPGPEALTLQPSAPRQKRKGPVAKHRLPADWSPRPQERDRARSAGIDPDAEADRFRDHHTARANTMADWDAAFRTWLGNAQRFANGTRAGPQNREPEQPRKIPTLA